MTHKDETQSWTPESIEKDIKKTTKNMSDVQKLGFMVGCLMAAVLETSTDPVTRFLATELAVFMQLDLGQLQSETK